MPPEVRAREAFGDLLPEVFSGEVLVKADYNNVVVALDEQDAEGRTDGRVDHLFLFVTLSPLIPPFTLSDAAAEIEYRPTGLRVLSHTKQRELELQINGAPPTPRPKQSVYSFTASRSGIHLYRYSGAAVKQLSLQDVSGEEAQLLTTLRDKSALLGPDSGSELGEFTPDPTAGSGSSSCNPSCSKSCAFGSCSAACIPGHCAKCECLGDPPTLFPSCFCA
ncbi:MAG TPA: hypothetical protein VEL74_24890 [Thermoanaerobaculia bacterium]|nr:hypothetical protein [Thermoanaerobaculia bacterium]